eukprot:4336402-Amphidinium_carterae.1
MAFRFIVTVLAQGRPVGAVVVKIGHMEASEAQAPQGVTAYSLFKDAADLAGVPDRVRIAFESELGGPDG